MSYNSSNVCGRAQIHAWSGGDILLRGCMFVSYTLDLEDAKKGGGFIAVCENGSAPGCHHSVRWLSGNLEYIGA